MEKELKKLVEESKEALEKAEEKIEALSKEFPEDAAEFWVDLKKYLSDIQEKLTETYMELEGDAELKANLGMMEAREKLATIQDTLDTFLYQVSKNTSAELDIAALKAHLAKKESEDLWEEKQKELSHLYAKSKVEVENLAKKAGKEFNEIFLKLTDIV